MTTLEDASTGPWLKASEVKTEGVYWCQHPKWHDPVLVEMKEPFESARMLGNKPGMHFFVYPQHLFHGPFTCPPLP